MARKRRRARRHTRVHKTQLVTQHLEHVAARVLEDYQADIRNYIRNRHGIYALYRKDKLYYVGLARNLRSRLRTHLKDRHHGRWTHFSVFLVIESGYIKELESLILRIVEPKGNKQRGRLASSQNLLRLLRRDIKRRHKEEERTLLGLPPPGREAPRPARTRSHAALARYVTKGFLIRGTLAGKTIWGRVRKNGWIRVRGRLFKSPSAAATRICGFPRNGLNFWHFERSPGDWVSLRALKQ